MVIINLINGGDNKTKIMSSRHTILIFFLCLFVNYVAKGNLIICIKSTNDGKQYCQKVYTKISCNDDRLLSFLGGVFPQGWTCGETNRLGTNPVIRNYRDGFAELVTDNETIRIASDDLSNKIYETLKMAMSRKIDQKTVSINLSMLLQLDNSNVSSEWLLEIAKTNKAKIINTQRNKSKEILGLEELKKVVVCENRQIIYWESKGCTVLPCNKWEEVKGPSSGKSCNFKGFREAGKLTFK